MLAVFVPAVLLAPATAEQSAVRPVAHNPSHCFRSFEQCVRVLRKKYKNLNPNRRCQYLVCGAK